MIDGLTAMIDGLHQQLADLEAKQTVDYDTVLSDTRDMLDLLQEPGENLFDLRTRVKHQIGQLVERVDVTVKGMTQADFTVRLKGGTVLEGDGLKWKKTAVAVWVERA